MYDFGDDILFGDDEVVIKHLYHYDAYLQLESVYTDDVISKNMISMTRVKTIVKSYKF